jgi:hypothetical protein
MGTRTPPTSARRLQLEHWPIGRFVRYEGNPRRHSDEVIAQVAKALAAFGFRVPVLARSDGTLVDGHLRLRAAGKIGLTEIPVILADDMTPEEIRAFRISVNKMAELADWDEDALLRELEQIQSEGFADLGVGGEIGFDLGDVGDAVAEIEAWDMSATRDIFVVTIQGSLPIEAEVRERLRGLEGVSIEASVIQRH